MKRRLYVPGVAILGICLALPSVGAATTVPSAPLKGDVNAALKEAKHTSFELRKSADRLHAITRAGGHSWESPSWYLSAAREDVNRLGKTLATLENMKPHSSEPQQNAIENMRLRLVQTANALTSAIELLNERRRNAYFPEYREAVGTVSNQAALLHQTLDAVVDSEAVMARLESLELSPAKSGS